MKKILIPLLLIFASCSKPDFVEYKITWIARPNTFACKYSAAATGKPEISFYDECGKYKIGEVVFRVEE